MSTAREATVHLADLLRREHHALGEFLLALATFDRERRWVDLGYSSLFSFLARELRLSAGAAQNRKTAAELVQKYPAVEAALRVGRLCLSTVNEVAKVLTPENAAEVLPKFFGLSAREAAFVSASLRPVENPPKREFLVTPVRGPASAEAPQVHGSEGRGVLGARWGVRAEPPAVELRRTGGDRGETGGTRPTCAGPEPTRERPRSVVRRAARTSLQRHVGRTTGPRSPRSAPLRPEPPRRCPRPAPPLRRRITGSAETVGRSVPRRRGVLGERHCVVHEPDHRHDHDHVWDWRSPLRVEPAPLVQDETRGPRVVRRRSWVTSAG